MVLRGSCGLSNLTAIHSPGSGLRLVRGNREISNLPVFHKPVCGIVLKGFCVVSNLTVFHKPGEAVYVICHWFTLDPVGPFG